MLSIIRFITFSALIVSAMQLVFAADIPVSLCEKLSQLKPGETTSVIVHFAEQPDLTRFTRGKETASAMIRYLKQLSHKNIRDLQAVLSQQNYAGELQPLWITNSVVLDVTRETAASVMALPSIGSIEEEERIVTDGSEILSSEATHQTTSLTPQWNISIIKADSVWLRYGITGDGITVGMMDSGVDTTHPTLISKWKGGPSSWFDAINGNSAPYDDIGHGTHTTGILVGGDGPGADINDIGVAYGAKFIVAKMLSSGFSTNAQVIAGAQWMLDPDNNPATNDFPDIINNSWFSNTRGSTWFYNTVSAWRAAGIIPVFCAGNFGPATESTRSPGDYNNCLSVGGTNSADDRYGATSVGPSATGISFPSDRRKPDISAPGQSVYSTFLNGFYGSTSGTSASAPHVSGTIALMLQANPALTYNDVLKIFKTSSVDLGSEGYDYVFGYGRIDAMEAVKASLRFRINVQPEVNLVTYESGDTIMFSVRLRVQPASTVFMHLSISDTTEGELVSNPLMVFTPEYWNTPQIIVIRGKSDSLSDGNVVYQLDAMTQSTDFLYDQISMALKTITNIDVPVLSVDDDDSGIRGYRLSQNYPNPFNPGTEIEFRIAKYSLVCLRIFDVLGREVATLVDEKKSPGSYAVAWDAASVPGGVYFYRLVTGEFSETKKMILLK